MAQDQANQLLQRGIQAARGNRPEVARDILQQAVRLDPQNEMIWLWLSSVARDNQERVFCLKQLLTINPDNEHALKGLQALGVDPAAATGSGQRGAVPVLSEEKYARLQPALDEFLRRYNPEPPRGAVDVEWVPKHRRRYGEGGAARLRRMAYAAAAVAILTAAIVALVVVSQLDILEGDGASGVAAAPTRIPTLTPSLTLTPTLGGPTPTAFPQPMAMAPTDVPEGLEQRGNPDGLVNPTEIYPRVAINVTNVVEQAAGYYGIGAYQEAVDLLATERERSEPECYASVIYFEALSLAALGEFDEAERLLNTAYTQEGERGYASCTGDPLLLAGLAEVEYLQNPQSAAALTLSQQALGEDPRLVQASLVKARVELAQGQIGAAWNSIQAALREWPEDTNLMIQAARIELANNQPATALEYIGQALYIEPALQPALRLQAEAYLRQAELADAGTERQLQYYGLAVISAQTLLLYYPGDPAGYLYLAQARMGEGNLVLAEEALLRVVGAADELPDQELPIVRAASRDLGTLYFRQGRFDDAQEHLTQVDTINGQVNRPIVERLVDIAFMQGDYSAAMSQLDRLIYSDTTNPSYQLMQARGFVELCTFYPDQLACEYSDMLEVLTDEFILGLSDEQQRADAYSYRAQALYHQYVDARSLPGDERELRLRLALSDLDTALAVRESAIDHYYRGLLLEALDEPFQALEEYQWVLYWGDVYSYPFDTNSFANRVRDLAERVQELLDAAQATPEPDSEATATATEDAATAMPSASPAPTNTPEPTATSTPSPTPPATLAPSLP